MYNYLRGTKFQASKAIVEIPIKYNKVRNSPLLLTGIGYKPLDFRDPSTPYNLD
jgi:hypothetical protein